MLDSIYDCWNKIGVWGDGECPKLQEQIHCRNCPVYSNAAVHLLNIAPSSSYLEERTTLIAEERPEEETGRQSVLIFRLGEEWLALSTRVFKEVAPIRKPHWIPHLRSPAVLGLVNVRGELLICVSIARALKLNEEAPLLSRRVVAGSARLLVLSDQGARLAFPVDEVGGVHRFSPKEIKKVPATVAGSSASHISALLSWQNRSVGQLDDQLLFYTFSKGLS